MKIKKSIKKYVAPVRLFWGYVYDFRRYKKYSFDFNHRNPSKDNLRSEITFQYHAIEKGLSHNNIRFGFGKAKIDRLFQLITDWENQNFSKEDRRFLAGIAVLDKYIKVHEKANYDVSEINDKLKHFSKYIIGKDICGGAIELNKEEFIKLSSERFDSFSLSRKSIRNYGKEIISKEKIIDAVNLATHYPSVCNRQAVKVHIITNVEKAKDCLKLQNGIQGMADNLSGVIIVTSDNQYFGNLNERNQSFIDGGIFTMNLLYALTYKNIASCTLNANLNTKNMDQMRKLFNIPDSENIIDFISYGSYPDICKFPVSNRDNANDIITFID